MAVPIIVLAVLLGLGLLAVVVAMGNSVKDSESPILMCSSGCDQASAMYNVTPDGTVTALNGTRHYGDLKTAKRTPRGRITHLVVTSTHCGYWLVDSSKTVYLFGDANRRSLADHFS